jgi:hypothetical protein
MTYAELLAADNAQIKWEDLNVVKDKPIGQGRYGTVYRGNLAGTPVAVKTLHAPTSVQLSDFEKEV